MRANFKVMILLALACGGGAIWAGGRWLDSATSERMAEIASSKPDVSFKTLVVAAGPLRFGTPLDRSAVKEIPWPEGELPPGAFSSIDELFKDGDRTALFALEQGEPILAGKLTGPGERAALSRLISDGNRAVTLRVNDVAGVGGLVLPGDRVDVVMTNADRAEVILQDVRILSIDQIADEKSAEPVLARTVTVEASPDAAQKLVLAQTVGSLSLVLRRAGEVEAVAFKPMSVADLTTSNEVATPPPTIAATAAIEPERSDATVWVRRATELTQYNVPQRGGPSRRVDPAAQPAPSAPAGDALAADAPAVSASFTTGAGQ